MDSLSEVIGDLRSEIMFKRMISCRKLTWISQQLGQEKTLSELIPFIQTGQ